MDCCRSSYDLPIRLVTTPLALLQTLPVSLGSWTPACHSILHMLADIYYIVELQEGDLVPVPHTSSQLAKHLVCGGIKIFHFV